MRPDLTIKRESAAASHPIMNQIQNSIWAQSIRHGLTLAIPYLIMGSFSLLFRNFPHNGYQDFLLTFCGGALASIFETIFTVSLGSLALVLAFTISLSYGLLADAESFLLYPLVTVCAYLAFCGGIQGQEEYIFSAEWVFTSMVITLLSCVLFDHIFRLSRRFERLHTTGAEYLFNISILSLLPAVLIILLFTVCGYLLRLAFGSTNITNFGAYLFLRIFDGISGNLFGILLYVLLTHVLWFFGIHGTNTLESVSKRLFEQNITINQTLLNAGQAPTEIFSKTFLDTFVFLGGCGCALSFVLALCIMAKKSHNRKLASVALPSTLFNISEIAVFGFPILFNFTMITPFLLTPLVLTLISFLAARLGLVPVVTQSVEWTVPILLSGYKATGAVSGSLLQLFNVVIGILIYIPFIKRGEQKQTIEFQHAVHQMELDMAAGERSGNLPRYLNHSYPYNYYAKTLAMDLNNAIKRGQVKLFYQAQISDQETLHGMEALLRWEHPACGYIAPPVIIGLAYENGCLNELSYYLLNKACEDAMALQDSITDDVFLSINISPKQLESVGFLDKVLAIISGYDLKNIHPILEITERTAMVVSDYLKEDIERLRRHGIGFSLDDFGMGHNSILQLQDGLFDEVKLDGNLVTQLLTNERSRDIISGIVRISKDLHCRIVAEYVETAELRDLLKNLGCSIYQGYFYSRPLDLEKFLDYVKTLS